MKHNTIIKVTLLIGIIIGSSGNICATSWSEYFSNLRQSASQWISSLSSGWSNLTTGQKALIGAAATTTAIVCAGGLCFYKMNKRGVGKEKEVEKEKEEGKEEEVVVAEEEGKKAPLTEEMKEDLIAKLKALIENMNENSDHLLVFINQHDQPWQLKLIFPGKSPFADYFQNITVQPNTAHFYIKAASDSTEIANDQFYITTYNHNNFSSIYLTPSNYEDKMSVPAPRYVFARIITKQHDGTEKYFDVQDQEELIKDKYENNVSNLIETIINKELFGNAIPLNDKLENIIPFGQQPIEYKP